MAVKSTNNKVDFKKVKWEKVEAGQFIKWENKGQMVQGILKSTRIIKTAYGKQKVYIIETEKGGMVSIGETAALANQLQDVKEEQMLKIVYQGMIKGKNKNKIHTFEVFIA